MKIRSLFGFVLLGVMISAPVAFCQQRSGFGVNGGFDRIGLYGEGALELEINRHQIHAGLRYYGPDYVFESHNVGLGLGYHYAFYQNRWYFAPGLNATFFKENKSATILYVSDLMVTPIFGYSFGNLGIYSAIGLGVVINKFESVLSQPSGVTSYINYEFSVGFKYYLHSSVCSR